MARVHSCIALQLGLAVLFVLVVPAANAQPSTCECFIFVDQGYMCTDCTETSCGYCVDLTYDVCEQPTRKVCRRWFITECVQTGHYKRVVNQKCYFYVRCATVAPCSGILCADGLFVEDGPGDSVANTLPNHPCPIGP